MRAFQAGKAFCQGLLGVTKAAAHDCNTAAQQWPSMLSQASSALAVAQGQAAGLLVVQAPAALQQQASRAFASFSRAPGLLQQRQHLCLLQQPFQQLPLPTALQQHQQQHQQRQLLPLGVRHFVLMPRRIKYRKAHKSMGFNETICPNTRTLAFGLYGIRAMEHCRIPARTLEAARRTLRRAIKKTAMLWIRVTPNVPVTSKPAEVRMGKGKGSLDYWAAPIRPGQIIFEMDRCSRTDALAALRSIQAKMPIKVGFVEWD